MRLARRVSRTGERKLHTVFCWGNLEVSGQLEDVGPDALIILKWILTKRVARAWTGLMRVRIGKISWSLWIRWWLFWFHKTGRICGV